MRFPSLRVLMSGAVRTLERFPAALASAFVATACGVLLIDRTGNDGLVRAAATAQLGIPLFFALSAVAQRFLWSASRRSMMALGGVAALVLYYVSLPSWMTPPAVMRYLQFNAGAHLLAAVLPYARFDRVGEFWHYNKTLFIRFLEAALYSAVLFNGLSIALVAVDNLFGIDVPGKAYPRLWVLIAGVFNTWFFLSRVPPDFRASAATDDYPTGLKIFAQYVLMPLVAVYLTILTVYLGKIVVTRVWPSGWIGYLVSTVSAAGIFALLLVYPVRDRVENKWVGTFSRWFFVCLIPSVFMLLLAIWQRIDQYGITEPRYFLLVLAVWLAGVSVYFIFSKVRNIQVIPATLCVLAFVTSAGPWGAYAVSRRSQVNRLEALLADNRILVEGRIQKAPESIPFHDRREISAVLSYLAGRHGVGAIEPWFGDSFASVDTLGDMHDALRAGQALQRVRAIMDILGVAYAGNSDQPGVERFSYSADPGGPPVDIAGADYFVRLQHPPGATPPAASDLPWVVYDENRRRFLVKAGGETILELSLAEMLSQLKSAGAETRRPAERMRVTAENDRARAVILVNQISGTITAPDTTVQNIGADCFLDLR